MAFTQSYLLVLSLNLPFYRDEKGNLFANELWAKDLLMHTHYLKNLRICCPCIDQAPPSDAVAIGDIPVQLVELPNITGSAQFLTKLPSILRILWKAVGDAEVVHSAIYGWPLPIGWFALPIAMLRGKKRIIVVESAPWRLQKGVKAGFKRLIRALTYEGIGRFLVKTSNLVIFTQDEYRQSMLKGATDKGHIISASWIDEKSILDVAEAEKSWQQKVNSPALKILFAGRLLPEKGVLVLLEAMRKLSASGCKLELSILGKGELLESCQQAQEQIDGDVKVSLLGTVSYGEEFFKVLREYHAVIIPSISDEQPRLVFDAYSQAVPVLASSTHGLRVCVEEGVTGRFFEANSSDSIAELLQSLKPDDLNALSLSALRYAHSLTHQEMHRKRVVLLREILKES